MSGAIGGKTVQFLVDSGASHNFMSRKQSEALQIQPTAGPRVRVRLADSSVLESSSFISVFVAFGEHHGSLLRFTVLDADCPSILGMQFLRRMNPCIDWQRRTLTFAKHTSHSASACNNSFATLAEVPQTCTPTISCDPPTLKLLGQWRRSPAGH